MITLDSAILFVFEEVFLTSAHLYMERMEITITPKRINITPYKNKVSVLYWMCDAVESLTREINKRIIQRLFGQYGNSNILFGGSARSGYVLGGRSSQTWTQRSGVYSKKHSTHFPTKKSLI